MHVVTSIVDKNIAYEALFKTSEDKIGRWIYNIVVFIH